MVSRKSTVSKRKTKQVSPIQENANSTSGPIISNIQLRNFKCFGKLDIELSKITLFTGANSSGKSSAIHSILGVMQTSEFPLKYNPNGRYVFMGDYSDIVLNHTSETPFSVNFTCKINNESLSIKSAWKHNDVNKLPEISDASIEGKYYKIDIKYLNPSRKYVMTFDYFSDRNPNHDEQKDLQKSILGTIYSNINMHDKNNDAELQRWLNFDEQRIQVSSDNLHDLSNLVRTNGGFSHTIIFQQAVDVMNRLEKKFNYIGSFRYEPEKTRDSLVRRTMKVRRNGENYEDQVILWQEQRDRKYTEFLGHLSKMNLISDLRPRRNRGGTYSIDVKNSSHGVFSGLHNVGFGLSQFAPIVVADLQLPNDSLLAVSQPEVHLHPAAQAAFADYMVDKMKLQSKSYLIETHSEYLLNRLRLLIVKGEISPDDVKVYHFSTKRKSQTAIPITLQKDGSIVGAPKDFFETYMMDTIAIAMNA